MYYIKLLRSIVLTRLIRVSFLREKNLSQGLKLNETNYVGSSINTRSELGPVLDEWSKHGTCKTAEGRIMDNYWSEAVWAN